MAPRRWSLEGCDEATLARLFMELGPRQGRRWRGAATVWSVWTERLRAPSERHLKRAVWCLRRHRRLEAAIERRRMRWRRAHNASWALPFVDHHPSPPTCNQQGLVVLEYNLGGPAVRPQRFGHILDHLRRRFAGRPLVCGFTEFRPTKRGLLSDYSGAARPHGMALLSSGGVAGESGGGVAFVVDPCVLVRCDEGLSLCEHVAGHLVSIRCDGRYFHREQPVDVALLYGPNQPRWRRRMEPIIDALLTDHPRLVLLGDFNAVTDGQADITSTRDTCSNSVWPWLVAHERSGALVDVLRPGATTTDQPPHTRVRRYRGSTSYLDRVYVSRQLWAEVGEHQQGVLSMQKVEGRSDHDAVFWIAM